MQVSDDFLGVGSVRISPVLWFGHRSDIMRQVLIDKKLYESEEESQKREVILGQLDALIQEWVREESTRMVPAPFLLDLVLLLLFVRIPMVRAPNKKLNLDHFFSIADHPFLCAPCLGRACLGICRAPGHVFSVWGCGCSCVLNL